jgi:protein translocase SecG subunit
VLTFFTVILSVALILVGLFAILLVLMQKSPEGGGFGSSLGGSAMESVFGGDAGDVLVRTTAKVVAIFFVMALLLSLCYVHRAKMRDRRSSVRLPEQIVAVQRETAGAEK